MADAKTYITKIEEKLNGNPSLSSSVNAVFLFKISGDGGGTWTLDLTKAPGSVAEGETATPNCTIIMTKDDFEAMMTKTANPMQLYMTQKLKVEGNLPLSLKLQQII